ncbi:hypothetical protein LMG3458_05271 [Achromobacter deleyi]|uniref:Uncharacterized protein n=1 Tax=Achromobacter deleyi TaxID=1353891 RepID=A0A6S7AJW2_9BURK|nr:hypothetical protein LMG3458_05271 [Achromobacter deleyi]
MAFFGIGGSGHAQARQQRGAGGARFGQLAHQRRQVLAARFDAQATHAGQIKLGRAGQQHFPIARQRHAVQPRFAARFEGVGHARGDGLLLQLQVAQGAFAFAQRLDVGIGDLDAHGFGLQGRALFDQDGGFFQRAVQPFDVAVQLLQLVFQVVPVGHGLHRGDTLAGLFGGGSMRVALLAGASQRLLRVLHAGARGGGLVRQGAQIGLVLLIAAHLLLQHRQRLRGLALFALQAVEGLALFGDRRQAGPGIGGAGLEVFPGLARIGARVLGAQAGQAVDVGVQLDLGGRAGVAFGLGAGQGVFGVFVDALGAAVARIEQRGAFGGHAFVQPVAIARGQFARQLRQRLAQVAAGMARGRLQVLAIALLDPQQPGHTSQVGLALPARGQFKAHQGGQRVLGLFAFQALGAVVDQQFAAGARQELLFQEIVVARMGERQFHAGARAGFAARRQVGHGARAVAFQERRANGRGHRALAGLVGADEQVQAVLQTVQHQGLAELAEFFQGNARELHCRLPWVAVSRPAASRGAALPPAPSRWNRSSKRSASLATAACSGSACIACNCVATSPT